MKARISVVVFILILSSTAQAQVAGDFRSKAGGTGLWNDFNAWERFDGAAWQAATSGQLPASTSDAEIQLAHAMTVNATGLACKNLIVNGSLTYVATPASALTVNGSVTVSATGSVTSPSSGTVVTHALNIGGSTATGVGGNLLVDGVFNLNVFSTAGVVVTFYGTPSNTISGAGSINFYSISVNKGSGSNNSILDVTSVITLASATSTAGQKISVTIGSFKLSSASTLNAFYGNVTPNQPNSARIWLNHPAAVIQSVGAGTVGGATGQLSLGGTLQIDAGTFSFGNGANFVSCYGNLTLGGPNATLNIYGYIQSGSASVYTITAGNINIYPQVGTNTVPAVYFSQTGLFGFGGSSLNFTGGTLTIVDPTLAVTSGSYYAPHALYITNGSGNLAGSTIRFGDGTSDLNGSVNGFTVSSASTLGHVIVNNASSSTSTTRLVKILRNTSIGGNLTINSGSANRFLLNGFALTMGGNINNAGTFVTDGNANNGLVFAGTTQQTIGGGGTFSDNVNNLTTSNTSGANPSVDLQVPLSVSNSLTLTNGSLGSSNVSIFTIGKSASSTTLNITRSGGSLALVPNLALGGVTLNNVTYNAPAPAASITTGVELPAATLITTFTVNNASGVTLDKPVSCTTLALTSGVLTTSALNSLSVTGSATTNITGGSATAYVNGPLTRTLPSNAAAANYRFPVGKTGYRLFEFSSITLGGTGTADFTAEAFDDGPYAGTPGTGLSAISTDKYWSLSGVLGSVTIVSSTVRLTDAGLGSTARVGQSNNATGTYNTLGGALGTGTISSVDPVDYSALSAGTYFRSGSASALTAGTYAIGPQPSYAGYAGTFPTFATAVNAATAVPLPGHVVFEFQSDYSPAVETFPINLSSNIATSVTSTLTFRPASSVTTLINFSAAGVIINNVGADYVTVDGRNGGTGTNRFFQFTNTSTTGAAVSLTGDAVYNQLLYCAVKGSNTSTTSGILFIGTPGAAGNNYYSIDNCSFDGSGSAHNCIYGTGLGSNATITNSSFFDYRNGGGINLNSGSEACIIDNNSFYQTLSYTGFAGTTYGIRVVGGNNCRISNNNIGGSGAALTGIWSVSATAPAVYNFTGLYATLGTGTASRIYSNKIQNFDWKSNPSTWTGINVSGNVNVGTGGANFVGDNAGNGSIQVTYYTTGTAQVNGIVTTGAAIIENNSIGSITTLLAAGVTATASNFTGISSSGNGVIRNNTIGSATTPLSISVAPQSSGTTAQNVYGFYSTGGTIAFVGNTIANVNNGSTIASGTTRGVMIPNYGSTVTITGNSIYSISTAQPGTGSGFTAASLNGINIQSNTASSIQVADNTIYDLVNNAPTAAVNVNGIYWNASTGANNVIERNYIHSFTTVSGTAVQNGLNINYGACTFRNNIVRLGWDKDGNSITPNAQITGILKASSATCNFYFNTVHIGGTGITAGALSTYALFISAHSTEDARNNIFFNARSGGGKNYAIRVPGTTPNPANLTCNYNDLMASGTGGVVGFYNNADQLTLSAWQAATGLDPNSQNVDPQFVSTTDFHPTNLAMNNTGVSIAGIVDDFVHLTRGVPPDMGALEFNVTHTITSSAGSNGTTDPLGVVVVNHGSDQSFTFAADPGYHVASVTVDGILQIPIPSSPFTFYSVIADGHTIDVQFEVDTYTLTINATNGAVALDPPGGPYLSGTVVSLTATPSAGYYFVDWTGDAAGTANPTTVTMNSNKSVTANFAAITLSLLSPLDGATGVSTTPTVTWNAALGADTYGLEIASDAGFGTVVFNQSGITGTSHTLVTSLASNTTYFWRINASNIGGTSSWSASWSFTTAIDVPTLVSPVDNATNVGITPTYSWNVVTGATSYALQVATDASFTVLMEDLSGLTGATYASTVSYVSNTVYFWRMNATGGGGTSAWSPSWSFTTVAPHNIALLAGWNMISSYIHPTNPSLETMLSSIAANMVIMKNGAGQVFWPSFAINTIGSWNEVESYDIYMQTNATLTTEGNLIIPESTPITLSIGWNKPAYIRNSPMAADVALSGIVAQLVIAKNNAGNVYWPSLGINTIGNMMPGEGYQVYMNQTSDLIYPSNSAQMQKVLSEAIQLPATEHFVSSTGRTGVNAIILVQCPDFVDGDEVGIMTTTRVPVGAGVVMGGKALVTVWGDNNMTQESVEGAIESELLSIRWWSRGGKEEESLSAKSIVDGLTGLQFKSALVFKRDAAWIVEAAVMREIPAEFVLGQNYPNPFNPSTTIRYGLPKDGRVRLTVFNLIGQQVASLIDGVEQEAGFHEIEFRRETLASGVYFYRLAVDNFVAVKRMILMK